LFQTHFRIKEFRFQCLKSMVLLYTLFKQTRLIINFPNMCSNIPASPTYGAYISQLIRYARASSNYSDFLKRHLHLRKRLLDQGYKKIRRIRSLKFFLFRYQDLVEIYSVSAEKSIKMTFQEIRIIATGPCIANQLWDVNTICRTSWYIAAHIWKIYDYTPRNGIKIRCFVQVLL
jgi:hypothetical protein